MPVVYNGLPIEMHVAMSTAELANVPVLMDAAKMWTEVRAWIESARVELHTKAHNLMPHWQDDVGRELEEKFQRTLAELQMWGERIDASQVTGTLTTLASAIPPAQQTVQGLYESYVAALSNPYTAGSAPAFQQASGAAMTALGGQFDMSMLNVATAAGIKSPADLVSGSERGAAGSSPDAASAIEAATQAMTALQSLTSAGSELADMVGGGGLGDPGGPHGLEGRSGGPSLAGLTPDLSPVASALPANAVPGVGGAPLSGGAPVPMGTLGASGLGGGAGLSPLAKPVAKRAPDRAGAEVRPGTLSPSGANGTASPGMMPPPMMPPHAGNHTTAGTLRPGAAEQPTVRSHKAHRAADGTEGVPTELRGRSGTGDPTFGFTQRRQGTGEAGSLQLLDEDLWQTNPQGAGRHAPIG